MSIDTTPTTEVTVDSTEIFIDPAKEVYADSGAHNVVIEEPNEVVAIKKEYSIVGDAFYAGINSDVAPSWLTNLIDAVVEASVANGLTDYDLLVQDVRNAISSIDVSANTYVEQLSFNDYLGTYIGQHLATLNTTVGQNSSQIVDLDLVVTNNDSAMATRVTDLDVRLSDDINSQITGVQLAYASEDLALATSIDSLTTAFTDQESNLQGTSSAVSGLQTYVGLTEESSPNGTGILSRINILENQTDGVVNFTTDTYDVMIGIEDPNNNTDNDQLDDTKEPYATWKADDELTSTDDARKDHIGDVYIMYADDANGTRTYIRSYKFIKTAVDTTSPYSTDTEGYTWAVVSDTDAQVAYTIALQAKDLADSKRRVFLVEPFPPYEKGDLWVDSSVSPQIIKVATVSVLISGAFSAGNWTLADEYAKDFVDNTYTPDSAQLHRQLDGKVEHYFYNTYTDVGGAISEANALTIIDSAWTTQVLKDSANGNTAYFKDTKNAYWYEGSNDVWQIITDTSIYEALQDAAVAQGAADGKVSQFFAWGGPDAPVDYIVVTREVEYKEDEYGNYLTSGDAITSTPEIDGVVITAEKSSTVKGEDFIYWFDIPTLVLYRKGQTGWDDKQAIPVVSGDGSYVSEGDVLQVWDTTPLDGKPRDELIVYSFNGSSWQSVGPNGIVSKSRFFVDLENAVTGPNGIVKAVGNLEITNKAYTDGAVTGVEGKFAYDSTLILDGLIYEAGFGLDSSGISQVGNDGLTYETRFDSKFKVNAEKFVLTSPTYPLISAEFTITESGIRLGVENTEATANSTDSQIRSVAAATSGTVGNWNIKPGYIYSGEVDSEQTTNEYAISGITLSSAGAIRAKNFHIDTDGNVKAKNATLESVTIQDSEGNVVMSSTGAVPSGNVTGLGSLATLNALAYDSLTSKPTLGSFAALNSLPYSSLTSKPTLGSLAALNSFAYNSLTGKPTLGTFAALNSLGYNSLTGKPTLGSLAALSSLAYNDVTGKPTLGPFAGLAKLLSTNVSTYIEAGAIGSAQIDQAYISELFGNNASFSGTVYAEKITGDLVDADSFTIPLTVPEKDSWLTIKTVNIQKSEHFANWLTVSELEYYMSNNAYDGDVFIQMSYGGQVGKVISIPAGTGTVSVTIQVKGRDNGTNSISRTRLPAQSIVLQMFRKGSGFIV